MDLSLLAAWHEAVKATWRRRPRLVRQMVEIADGIERVPAEHVEVIAETQELIARHQAGTKVGRVAAALAAILREDAIPKADAAVLRAFAGPYCSIEVVMISDPEGQHTPARGRVWRYVGHDVAAAREMAERRQNPTIYVRKNGQWAPA